MHCWQHNFLTFRNVALETEQPLRFFLFETRNWDFEFSAFKIHVHVSFSGTSSTFPFSGWRSVDSLGPANAQMHIFVFCGRWGGDRWQDLDYPHTKNEVVLSRSCWSTRCSHIAKSCHRCRCAKSLKRTVWTFHNWRAVVNRNFKSISSLRMYTSMNSRYSPLS